MSDVNSHACGAALPEKDDIKPEDSVSNVSGAITTASKTPSLKSRLRFAKRNAELRAFKKKMEMELTLADIDVEEQKARAKAPPVWLDLVNSLSRRRYTLSDATPGFR